MHNLGLAPGLCPTHKAHHTKPRRLARELYQYTLGTQAHSIALINSFTKMQPLNFPAFQFRFAKQGDKELIFDPVRKKMVALTPEEWVRQNMLAYLVEIKQVPLNLVGVEKQLIINGLVKRFDIAVFDRNAKPVLLVECKAPTISINQNVFDQAARYNLQLNVNYFFITNGLQHFCCRIDYENSSYKFVEDLPLYPDLK